MSQDNKKQTANVLNFKKAALGEAKDFVLIDNFTVTKNIKGRTPFGNPAETDVAIFSNSLKPESSGITDDAFLQLMEGVAEAINEDVVVDGGNWLIMTGGKQAHGKLLEKCGNRFGYTPCDTDDVQMYLDTKKKDMVLHLVRGMAEDLENVEGPFDVHEYTQDFIFDALEYLGFDMARAENDFDDLYTVVNQFFIDEREAKKTLGEDVPEGVRELLTIHYFHEKDLKRLIEAMLENAEEALCKSDYYMAESFADVVLRSVLKNENNLKTGIFDKATKLSNMNLDVPQPDEPSSDIPVRSNG